MAKFSPRTSNPTKDNKFYYTDINPWVKKKIGSCTCYAQGRILELENASFGTSKKKYTNTWYPIDMYNKCSEVGAKKVSTPIVGCGAVWKSKDLPNGHIAIVESVSNDTITYSQWDRNNNYSNGSSKKSDGWKNNGMELVGFFDCQFKWDAVTPTNTSVQLTSKSYPDYPSGSGKYYRVKDKNGTQLGAYTIWANAFKKWDEDHTRHIYDANMTQLDASTTAAKSTTKTVVTGQKINLVNTPVYSTENGKSAGTRTGTYYVWDGSQSKGYVKMTNNKAYCKVKGKVSFWCKVSEIV